MDGFVITRNAGMVVVSLNGFAVTAGAWGGAKIWDLAEGMRPINTCMGALETNTGKRGVHLAAYPNGQVMVHAQGEAASNEACFGSLTPRVVGSTTSSGYSSSAIAALMIWRRTL